MGLLEGIFHMRKDMLRSNPVCDRRVNVTGPLLFSFKATLEFSLCDRPPFPHWPPFTAFFQMFNFFGLFIALEK